jgi:hypothetical protein
MSKSYDPVQATMNEKAAMEAYVDRMPGMSKAQKDALKAKNAAYYQELLDRRGTP